MTIKFLKIFGSFGSRKEEALLQELHEKFTNSLGIHSITKVSLLIVIWLSKECDLLRL